MFPVLFTESPNRPILSGTRVSDRQVCYNPSVNWFTLGDIAAIKDTMVMLTCKNCGQTILPTDTVCWHCGQELTPIKSQPAPDKLELGEPGTTENNGAISITAVSIFTLITLITILLFIIVTNALAG